MTSTELPKYADFQFPTLEAIRRLGGSGTVEEIEQAVIEHVGFSEEQQAIKHKNGPRTEIGYRVAWAQTYLKKANFITNSERGVWSITDLGKQASEQEVIEKCREVTRAIRNPKNSSKTKIEPRPDTKTIDLFVNEPDEPDAPDWKENLLDALMKMDPFAFERLVKRLLREAGFSSVQVTGKPGDNGIDGFGYYRMALVTFPVFFQCKRYSGSVGADAIRDFRGAMSGRGDKGLLVTTGTFTKAAQNEAVRLGAAPVDLVDGNSLCDLLRKFQIGVKTVERIEEDIIIDNDFFNSI